jgi:hypothetical protein
MSYESPNINGTTPCGESSQVNSTKHPTRPAPGDGSGTRNPKQGGL